MLVWVYFAFEVDLYMWTVCYSLLNFNLSVIIFTCNDINYRQRTTVVSLIHYNLIVIQEGFRYNYLLDYP